MEDSRLDAIDVIESGVGALEQFLRLNEDSFAQKVPGIKGMIVRIKEALSMLKSEGEWLPVGYGKPNAWDCSVCGAMAARKCLYCPGCGTRMKNGTRQKAVRA